jgi:L-seryl-tRNA(Ser) seleniumtransferase
MAAALQHLDLDVVAALWRPPAALIDTARLKGPPRHGVGRACKIGKEQVAGLLAALEAFVEEGDAARHARWLEVVEAIASGLPRAGLTLEIRGTAEAGAVPKLAVSLSGGDAAARALISALEDGCPRVTVEQGEHRTGTVVFNPVCLQSGDGPRVAEATRAALAQLP